MLEERLGVPEVLHEIYQLQGLPHAQVRPDLRRLRAQDVPTDGEVALRLPRRLPEEGRLQLPQVPVPGVGGPGGLRGDAVLGQVRRMRLGGRAGSRQRADRPLGQAGLGLRGDLARARARAAVRAAHGLPLPGEGPARRGRHRDAAQGEAHAEEEGAPCRATRWRASHRTPPTC